MVVPEASCTNIGASMVAGVLNWQRTQKSSLVRGCMEGWLGSNIIIWYTSVSSEAVMSRISLYMHVSRQYPAGVKYISRMLICFNNLTVHESGSWSDG